MIKSISAFLALALLFSGTWAFKSKTPSVRPSTNQENAVSAPAWWETGNIENLESQENTQLSWTLDPEIPSNYIPIPGQDELYMVVNEEGLIECYRQREKIDGIWVWETVNPDIPDGYEPVEGLEDVYRTVLDGETKYYKYTRNADDTYAFTEVDENGNEIVVPTGNIIPDNYHRIDGTNVYEVVNEHGIVIGYKERSIDANGNNVWTDCEKPNTNDQQVYIPDMTVPTEGTQQPGSNVIVINPNGGGGGSITSYDGQTYTETESVFTTEIKGGYRIKMETVYYREYSSDGMLISTRSVGPTEVSRELLTTSNPNVGKICDTLADEYARIKVGTKYEEGMAQEVLSLLNAERAAQGLSALRMDKGSDMYIAAMIRAASMANYNISDYDNPDYGTLAKMMTTYEIPGHYPSENLWRTTNDKSAEDIHRRFMYDSASSMTRLDSTYSQVAIAIVSKGGYIYVCEIYIA